MSNRWGKDRGTPIDRYYIEQFLEAHRTDIRGRTLEIKDAYYTVKFGGDAVTHYDVLDVNAENTKATIVADLADAEIIPDDQFDCFICTQTLQLIYDVRSAILHSYRILKPGGVLLATIPSLSRVVENFGLEGDYWRFTSASCKRLFGEVFGRDQIEVQIYGNTLTGAAFFSGFAAEEIPVRKLDVHDEYFPILMGVRAVKQVRN